MNYELVILENAERDTFASLVWYKLRSPLAAKDFLKELSDCYNEVLRNPGNFPRARGRIKQARLKRFPFKIYFEVVGPEILVLRVYHMRRDPRKRFAKRK